MAQDFPPPPDWARFALSSPRLRRGETLRVQLELDPGREGLELGFACLAHHAQVETTWDGDVPGRVRNDRPSLREQEWVPVAPGLDEHAFAVPAEAPYHYEGELLSFYWALHLRAAGTPDLLAYVPVTVLP